MALDALYVSLWAFLVFVIIILWPICFYASHILYKHWNKQYFVKRKRQVIRLMLALASISLIDYPSDEHIQNYSYFYETSIVPLSFAKFTCTYLLTMRVWLFYFDVGTCFERSSNEWYVLLGDDNEKFWFIPRRKTIGNWNWWTPRIVLVSLIISITRLIVYLQTDSSWCDIAIANVYFITSMLTLVAWLKYPKFNDRLGIRNEIKRIVSFWTFGILFVEASVIIMWKYQKDDNIFDLAQALAFFGIAINMAALVYVTIIDVHRRAIKTNDADAKVLSERMRFFVEPSSPYSPSGSNSNLTGADAAFPDVKIASWRPIVAKVDGYNIYTKFLREEFSQENLLWLTEYIQFKNALIEYYGEVMQKLKDELPWMLELPMNENEKGASTGTSSVPLGTITKDFRLKMNEVRGAAEDYSVYMDAYCQLSEKYIDNSADFQININSMQRQQILNVVKEKNKYAKMRGNVIESTLPYFENAAQAIEGLMNDSFLRFKRTYIAKEFWQRFVENE